MASGMTHSIGVLVKGHNDLSASLTKAENSLTSFRKTAEATALSVNSKLKVPDLDTRGVDRASSRLSGMGTAAMVAGGVVAAGLGVAVQSATSFNTAMAEVATLVDTSTTDMGAMTDTVRSLSKEYGRMPVDTAKALYTTISAGFGDARDSTVMLEGALKLARGGLTDTETAIDGLTSIMNSYGMAADQVTGVSDQMFVAMKAGKTTIGELSSSLGKVTPLASSAGVSLDQLLAATSSLTLGGLKTSEAVTSLRGMLAAVVKPTSEATKIAEEMGIEFSGAAVKSMGLANWLAHVKEKTGGSQETMAQLFGSVEALSGVLALTGAQAGSFASILGQMGSSAGATQEAFLKVDSTAGAAFEKAKASAAVLLETLGNALLPVITYLAQGLTWVVERISAFAEAHPFLAKLIGVLIGVAAAVALVGGAAMTMGGKVSAAMATVNMSTGGVILVIGALVTGITVLVMHFTSGTEEMGEASKILAKVWDFLKSAFYALATPIAYGLGFLVGVFTRAWQGIYDYTAEIWPLIEQVVVGAWNGIQLILGPGIAILHGLFIAAWGSLKVLTKAAWEAIELTVVTIWNSIYESIMLVWNLISGLFKAALQLLTGDWEGAWNTIKETFSNVWENLKNIMTGWLDWLTGLGSIFLEAGEGLINALWDGITGAWDGLVESVSDLLDGLVDLLPFSDAKEGPLSQLTSSGSALVTTFSDGINAVADVPMDVLSGLLDGVRDLLPFSDAKRGPLSDLTQSGAAVLPTFAAGIEKTGNLPADTMSRALSGISMEVPAMPSIDIQPLATTGAPVPAEARTATGTSVVFQRGAFHITLNSAGEPMDDLEERLVEVFSRVGMRMGA